MFIATDCGRGPPFVSLENLGNTCYMNSILQVLRYTPDFVTNLETLSMTISALERSKRLKTKRCAISFKPLVWEFVRHLSNLFIRMARQEEACCLQLHQKPPSQPCIRPTKVMDILCKLNPMFAGRDQHDAHELLRCIQSYVQEAAGEVHRCLQDEDTLKDESVEITCCQQAPEHTCLCEEAAAVWKALSSISEARSGGPSPYAATLASVRPLSVSLTRLSCPANVSATRSAAHTCPTAPGAAVAAAEAHSTRAACASNQNGSDCCTVVQATAHTGVSGSRSPAQVSGFKRKWPMIRLPRCDHLLVTGTTRTKLPVMSTVQTYAASSSEEEDDCSSNVGLMQQQQTHTPVDSTGYDKRSYDSVNSEDEGYRFLMRHRRLLCQAAKASYRLFHGECAIRTKCLECEMAIDRPDSFAEITIPVHQLKSTGAGDASISDDEELTEDSLISRAFNGKEVLAGDNKYFCEVCNHHTEAGISTYYKTVPPVLTFHLKRFTVTTCGQDGSQVMKINDHLSTPSFVPCFTCTMPCVKPSHQYHLYAIVMHSGSTVDSGHYTSFIKFAQKKTCQSGGAVPTPSCQGKSLSRPCATPRPPPPPLCGLCSLNTSIDQCNSIATSAFRGDSESNNAWFEFDDRRVRIYTAEEFSNCLRQGGSTCLTPYLLFYSRATSCDSALRGDGRGSVQCEA